MSSGGSEAADRDHTVRRTLHHVTRLPAELTALPSQILEQPPAGLPISFFSSKLSSLSSHQNASQTGIILPLIVSPHCYSSSASRALSLQSSTPLHHLETLLLLFLPHRYCSLSLDLPFWFFNLTFPPTPPLESLWGRPCMYSPHQILFKFSC